MEKVLVIGGAGFIGSHTVDALVRTGREVRVLDGLCPPTHRGSKPSYLAEGVEFVLGDVLNREDLLRALQGVSVVYNFAAYQDYLTDFSKFFQVNVTGTALLYELIVQKDLPIHKVIVASSQSVYGEGKYECMQHGALYPPRRCLEQLEQQRWEVDCPHCGSTMKVVPSDESRVNPQNQYGISKYAQELLALNLGERYGVPTVVLRYSIVQGPRQSFHNAYSGACRIFIMSLLQGRPLPIYEDGLQARDFVNIEDVVTVNLLVLERPEADCEVFNVGGGTAYTVMELAREVAWCLGRECRLCSSGEFRFGDSRHMLSDVSKISRLGWRPLHSMRKSVADYVEWILGQRARGEVVEEALQAMRSQGIVRSSTA